MMRAIVRYVLVAAFLWWGVSCERVEDEFAGEEDVRLRVMSFNTWHGGGEGWAAAEPDGGGDSCG